MVEREGERLLTSPIAFRLGTFPPYASFSSLSAHSGRRADDADPLGGRPGSNDATVALLSPFPAPFSFPSDPSHLAALTSVWRKVPS